MKRIALIAALLLLTISSFAQNGRSIYQKYSDTEGVSAVYISPAMFRLMGKMPDLQMEGEDVNLAPLVLSLSGLYLISCEDSAVGKEIIKDAEKLVAAGKYELLLEAKDSGEAVRIYTVGDDKTVTGFVMIAADSSETTFICLDGTMEREELENLLAQSMATE